MSEIVELLVAHKVMSREEALKTFNRMYGWLNEAIIPASTEKIMKHFEAMEESGYDEVVTIRNIAVSIICPHHLMPVELIVDIGYVPCGRVLGLSKFARIARDLSCAIKQEDYTSLLAHSLLDGIKCRIVMVSAVGKHSCMRSRGIYAADCETVTRKVAVRLKTREEHITKAEKQFFGY